MQCIVQLFASLILLFAVNVPIASVIHVLYHIVSVIQELHNVVGVAAKKSRY